MEVIVVTVLGVTVVPFFWDRLSPATGAVSLAGFLSISR